MKKPVLLIFLFLFFASCHQEKGEIIIATPEQVYEAVYEEASPQLLDVRTEGEYLVSHLKNAQNICVTSDDFQEKAASLDKEKPVYVYCKGGGRSSKAAQILRDMGFTKVYDLQGGLKNWQLQGYETVQ
ncbi:MAG: rhodanese-like domain-containing protein [Flavobacteriaceae bacterium]